WRPGGVVDISAGRGSNGTDIVRSKAKRVTIGGRPPELKPPMSTSDSGRTEFNADSAVRALGSFGARTVPDAAAESWVRRGGSDASADLAANLAAMLPAAEPARAREAARETTPTAEPVSPDELRDPVAETIATVATTAE